MLPYPCGVELSHSRKAIKLLIDVKNIYVNKTNVIYKRLKFLRLR